jgi:hypothetical protein
MVMSLISYIGTERNILDEAPENCHTLKLPHPILTNRDLEKLRRVSSGDLLATTLPRSSAPPMARPGLKHALDDLSARAAHAVKSGYTLLILSDRGVDPTYAPIPSLLAMAAVHNRLVREKTRTQVALIIESGEPREVMHFALLIGYGASAINPLPGHRDAARPEAARPAAPRRHRRVRREELHQGHQQGPAEDLLEDGHQHPAKLSRRAGLRGRGAEQVAGGRLLLRHRFAHRGRGPGRAGARGAAEARVRLPAADRVGDRTGGRRPVSVSARAASITC